MLQTVTIIQVTGSEMHVASSFCPLCNNVPLPFRVHMQIQQVAILYSLFFVSLHANSCPQATWSSVYIHYGMDQ